MFKNVKEFVADAGSWGLTSVLAAAVSLGISIWEHVHDKPISSLVFVCLTALLFGIGCYRAWLEKKQQLEAEGTKNQLAPDVQIEIPRLISAWLGSITKELFLNVILTLKNPREVSLDSFELVSVRNGVENTARVVNDLDQWERLLQDKTTGYKHLPLKPLSKELNQRGNPVEGWLHFAIDSSESDLYDSTLRLKVNSAHGTCLCDIPGVNAFPNAKQKGVVRRRIILQDHKLRSDTV
jgi:hypothetical protein